MIHAALLALTPLAGDGPPELRWVSTEHLGRLTGTERNPLSPVGLAGTDLGVGFEAHGKLVFLFGDAWTLDKQDWDADSVALAERRELAPGELPPLSWLTRPGGRFLPLAPEGLRLGAMEVPVEGLATGERTYVFFDGGWDAGRRVHGRSILAHAERLDFAKLAVDHDVASAKFLNLSAVVEDASVWIFGTGPFRKSGVHLARVPLADLADRAAWRYWPDFAAGEERARQLVEAGDLGELSVRRMPWSRLWWMACNGLHPRGVQLRAASKPDGPWSAPVLLFDPERDGAYGRFMHRSTRSAGFDDGLSDRGREDEWGGEYGPYLVPHWSSRLAPGVHALVYTLSSWNPYQVHLMRSVVAEPGSRLPEAPAGAKRLEGDKPLLNPRFARANLEHWVAQGDAFAVRQSPDGSFEVCSYVLPKGDGVRGALWQDFCVPLDARELRCTLRGGTECVRLKRRSEILRESRGPRSNEVGREVRWTIDELRGEVLRIEIADESSEPWGFVVAGGFEIVR